MHTDNIILSAIGSTGVPEQGLPPAYRHSGWFQRGKTAADECLRGGTDPGAQRWRVHYPDIRIVAVEPGESAGLSGGKPGLHKIEGVGIGYSPPLGKPGLVDSGLKYLSTDVFR